MNDYWISPRIQIVSRREDTIARQACIWKRQMSIDAIFLGSVNLDSYNCMQYPHTIWHNTSYSKTSLENHKLSPLKYNTHQTSKQLYEKYKKLHGNWKVYVCEMTEKSIMLVLIKQLKHQ